MKILYLNTNGFYGHNGYNKNSKKETNINNARAIFKMLFEHDQPDLIFFSEFDVNSIAGEFVINELKEKGYSHVFPNHYEYMSKRYTSIVIAFTKEKKKSEKSPTKKALKWNEIQFDDYRIVGLHIPDSKNEEVESELFWQSLKKHYKTYKDEKIIYIGDMNVFEEGTVGKQYFNSVFESARDAWIEKVNSNDTETDFTFIGRTRVDYVILSETMPKKFRIRNIQDVFKKKYSDHSALIIEI